MPIATNSRADAAPVIFPIQAFSDNYIWCIHDTQCAYVVDPGDANPVERYLDENQLTLKGILVTHHHWDHTNGIEQLRHRFPAIPVYGPSTISHVTQPLRDGDNVELKEVGIEFLVFAVPGHTLDHIAYVSDNALFCGDTLFSAGCGRLFEGTPAQMHTSLSTLSALADDLQIYCTHEYTAANVDFALTVEPNNSELQTYNLWVKDQRAQKLPTLPSSVRQEKLINPFLRTSNKDVMQRVEQYHARPMSTEIEVFAGLRAWKDNF